MATWRTWQARLAAGIITTSLVVGGATVWPHAWADEATASATSSTAEVVPVSAAVDLQPDRSALESIDADGRWSVAVLDTSTGETLTYGDTTGTYDTASIVKVDILAALLDQQDGELTEGQLELASAMIRRSDNDAASTLLAQVGGADALDAFNADLGLEDTDVSSTWGLTQTTAADQVRLLQAVLGDDSILTESGQSTLAELMSTVIDAQRFGVSAAADDPSTAALKVGYLQRSATGLWDVTSIGVVERDGRTLVVAVLSDGNASFDAGVDLTEQVASAAAQAVDSTVGTI